MRFKLLSLVLQLVVLFTLSNCADDKVVPLIQGNWILTKTTLRGCADKTQESSTDCTANCPTLVITSKDFITSDGTNTVTSDYYYRDNILTVTTGSTVTTSKFGADQLSLTLSTWNPVTGCTLNQIYARQ